MLARRTEISPIVEAEIMSMLEHQYGLIAAAMSNEAGRATMRNYFLQQLHASAAATLSTEIVIAAAEAGNEAADAALRLYIADCVNNGPELTPQLKAYNIRSLLRPPVRYPRGTTSTIDHLTRDVAIRVLIELTAERWRIAKTRSAGSTEPAAAHFVAKLLRRHGHRLKEGQINRIYWQRGTLAARVAATLFPSSAF
jgi:hypothetical protein